MFRFVLTVYLMAFCTITLAQESAEPLSANGRYRVASVLHKQHMVLMLSDTNSNEQKILVQLPGDNQFPVWSPDSNFIAFCASFRDRYFITVTDLTGHSWMVAEIGGECSAPVWSPDAVWLAFSSKTKFGDRDIYIATAGGTDYLNVTNSRGQSEMVLRWSSKNKSELIISDNLAAVEKVVRLRRDE